MICDVSLVGQIEPSRALDAAVDAGRNIHQMANAHRSYSGLRRIQNGRIWLLSIHCDEIGFSSSQLAGRVTFYYENVGD